jgi:hypothetical protein
MTKEQTIEAMARAIEMARATIERDIPADQRGHVQATASALATAAYTVVQARIEALEEALGAIKELADAEETFLCWKTANDALTHKDVAP